MTASAVASLNKIQKQLKRYATSVVSRANYFWNPSGRPKLDLKQGHNIFKIIK